MNEDLAKIKKILEVLDPNVSVVEFIPPAPPPATVSDENPKQDPKTD
jgi:hypothetical protein